ncbi:asparaginase [Streptomyces sp. NPDC058653]|uniref:asparaginase n=1 Tax=Streptomyces sp. NPDC058653 TaxID=3346576 RepID=UPI003647AE9B
MRGILRRTALLTAVVALTAGTATAAEQHKSPVKRPKVAVIGTGGTIAGVSDSRVDFQDYQSGKIPVAELVGDLKPEVNAIADVSTVQFGNKGSGSYSIAEFRELTLAVDKALRTNDAAVVTTGTDTMEEFAYWLDLTVRSDKPVILTGAMRPWTVLGTDGPANLYNAIQLAASRKTTCFGSVIMLNDEVQAAREVRKTDALRMDTFNSGASGSLGVVDQERVRINRAPARVEKCGKPSWRTPFDVGRIGEKDLPKVEIAYSYQGAGGEAVKAFADAGADGVVTAGTGAGGISSAMSAARADATKQGVVFASTTRTGNGAVYDEESGGAVVGAADLGPQKARILLLLSLAKTDDVEKIRGWFTTLGTAEFQNHR